MVYSHNRIKKTWDLHRVPDTRDIVKMDTSTADAARVQIEITDFQGSAGEAVDFVNASWSARFPENFSCPQWDEDYFEWQMFAQPQNIRLAAYHDNKLVGFVFGEPLQLRWKERSVFAMFSTALAADPAFKGKGVAKSLAAALNQRLQEGGMAFVYGFAVPGSGSQGPKFWQGSQGAKRVKSVGVRPWVRPIDAKMLSKNAGERVERIAARFADMTRFDSFKADENIHIRSYKPDDLQACLALVQAAEADADLRYNWTPDRLQHQLHYNDIPKTYIFDDGMVSGFINFHQVWFRGRQRFSAGMIDHVIAADGRIDIQKALLGKAIADMHGAGQSLAICATSAGIKAKTLFRNRFVPLPDTFDCMCPFMSSDFDLSELKTVMVHLR